MKMMNTQNAMTNENVKGMIRMRKVMSFDEVALVAKLEGIGCPDRTIIRNTVSLTTFIPSMEEHDWRHFEFFRELVCSGLDILPRMASILMDQVEMWTGADSKGCCHFKAKCIAGYGLYYERIAEIWREHKEKFIYSKSQRDIDGGYHWFLFKGKLSDAEAEELVGQFVDIEGVEYEPSPYDCTGQYFSDAIEIVRSPFRTLVKQSFSYDV